MANNPTDRMLADLKDRYEAQPASPTFSELYEGEEYGHIFAVLHQSLNGHFAAINDRARSTHHYWADDSRQLLKLIDELTQDLHDLKRAGIEVELAAAYQAALDRCEPWLTRSGGSTVPDDFEQIDVIKYESVFSQSSTTVKLKKQSAPITLSMVGEGSYANVYSYIDPDYGIKFAVKRAKKDLDHRDLHRFKQEFEVMRSLSFPYVVAVYTYDEDRNEYRMEFCDETLRAYVATRNSTLHFASRKRIALQFLYGMNYIHSRKLLHRDISLQNVLMKVFESGAVLVKLSDFGLVKDESSEFTRTATEMRGTIRDPLLHSFKDYKTANEIYAIGWVLSYIFTGRDSLSEADDEVGRIVQKCTAHAVNQRYASVLEIIADLESLHAIPVEASA